MLATIAVVIVCCVTVHAVIPPVNPSTITISGFSSGGFFAVQFEFIYSSIIRGAAIAAGGPYRCSNGTVKGVFACMSEPNRTNVTWLNETVYNASRDKLIDDVRHLASHTVLLFSGRKDTLVHPRTMLNLQYLYTNLTAKPISVFNISSGHAWVTDKYGSPCGTQQTPFINNCNYDFGGDFLRRAFAAMNVPFNSKKGQVDMLNMYGFNQTMFGADQQYNSMDSTGWVYIPDRCKEINCHLHVHFHGCYQSRYDMVNQYVLDTELNEWAESNNMIILYPQAITNYISNPAACFDWWGYTDRNFSYNTGRQPQVVRRMIDSLVKGTFSQITCAYRPLGMTCITAQEYIMCPSALVVRCNGLERCHQIAAGMAECY